MAWMGEVLVRNWKLEAGGSGFISDEGNLVQKKSGNELRGSHAGRKARSFER